MQCNAMPIQQDIRATTHSNNPAATVSPPLLNTTLAPPSSGTTWNANFYRLDYDSGKMIKYSWMPIDHSFHEFEKFKPIKFE